MAIIGRVLAILSSAALQGVEAELVQVEVNANEAGEPKLILVGLPDAAVKESDDRVFSALGNSGFDALRTRATINLAPGDLRKEGPIYDLPIALAILVATGQLAPDRLGGFLIAGELSLSGATRPIRGGLAMARLARRLGKQGVLLPGGSAEEAALVDGVSVHRVESLDEAFRFLAGEKPLPRLDASTLGHGPAPPDGADFRDIKGQAGLRRAVEVAAAGGHNLLILYHFALYRTNLEAAPFRLRGRRLFRGELPEIGRFLCRFMGGSSPRGAKRCNPVQ